MFWLNAWRGFKLTAQCLDVFGHRYGLDAVGVVGVVNAKSTGLGAFADQRVTALDDVLLDEHLAAPLLNVGVNTQPLPVGGGADKAGFDFQQRRADDAGGFVQVAPGRDTAFDKKIQR